MKWSLRPDWNKNTTRKGTIIVAFHSMKHRIKRVRDRQEFHSIFLSSSESIQDFVIGALCFNNSSVHRNIHKKKHDALEIPP